MGLQAVGIGGDAVQEIIAETTGAHTVLISCYQSPASVTLSGYVVALDAVKTRLHHRGVFARLLQVDLAYYSPAMNRIAEHYEQLL
jgi:acyl transferase domain-containing protein